MQFIDFQLVRESEAQKKENQSTDKKKIKADLNQVKEKNHGKS